MKLQLRDRSGVGIIDLQGKLTIGREDLELRDRFVELIKAGHSRFVLNLKDVDYVDSSGLGEIVACKKRALDRGGDVKLLAPTPRVRDLLQLSRLTEVFQIFEEEEKAVKSF